MDGNVHHEEHRHPRISRGQPFDHLADSHGRPARAHPPIEKNPRRGVVSIGDWQIPCARRRRGICKSCRAGDLFRTFTTHAIYLFLPKVVGSSYINHFIQPDSLIPAPLNPQSLNRYAYVLNNPIRYNDPSGHCIDLDEGLCVRRSKDGTHRVVHGGKVFANRVEVAFANHFFSGLDPRYIENLPSGYDPSFVERSAKAAGYHWGYSNYDPILDLGWDPSTAAAMAAGVVTAFSSWKPGQSPQVYIKGLEGVDPNAHAWEKHGPNASDEYLRQQSLKSSSAQTKFASGDEMANAISETLSMNMADIESKASSGAKGNVPFTGPVVNYSGYQQGSSISGQGPTIVVINFDGNGGWTLRTAYPSTR